MSVGPPATAPSCISATVRTRPRVKPLGLVRNQANVCRAAADPRPPPRRLMVSMARGASPVKRLPTASPSSASNPAPSVARCSMTAASSGRFAIKTRPSSRSYQRKAGTPATVPCRIPS